MSLPWATIRLSAMGDALLITGVLEYWRQTRQMKFTVLTRAALAPLFEHHPAVSRVVPLRSEDLTPLRLITLARHLSKEHAGLIDLHGNLRSRIFSASWRGTVHHYIKLGLERRLFLLSHGQLFAQRLSSLNVPQRYALALESDAPDRSRLLPRLFLTSEEQAWAKAALASVNGPIVMLHPYATHRNKMWPEENWRSLIRRLLAEGLTPIVIGRQADPMPHLVDKGDFTNKTSLRETAALLAQASILITGDSGPMHLAASVGTPVIALFGPTTEAWGFAPAGTQDTVLQVHDLSCRPCSLHGSRPCSKGLACMLGLTPEAVFDTVRSRLFTDNTN